MKENRKRERHPSMIEESKSDLLERRDHNQTDRIERALHRTTSKEIRWKNHSKSLGSYL